MSQNEQYDPKVLRKLQLAELEVFKDIIKILNSEKINLAYDTKTIELKK